MRSSDTITLWMWSWFVASQLVENTLKKEPEPSGGCERAQFLHNLPAAVQRHQLLMDRPNWGTKITLGEREPTNSWMWGWGVSLRRWDWNVKNLSTKERKWTERCSQSSDSFIHWRSLISLCSSGTARYHPISALWYSSRGARLF